LRSEAVYATRTVHEEDQPSHLVVPEPELCAMKCREEYDHPCVRFCPAGVYGIEVQPDGGRRLIVQASNCIHCKTCSVADPYGGITWLPPEGGSGPRYDRM
jgi:electron-transferring-flavoprotein dehydrogenase